MTPPDRLFDDLVAVAVERRPGSQPATARALADTALGLRQFGLVAVGFDVGTRRADGTWEHQPTITIIGRETLVADASFSAAKAEWLVSFDHFVSLSEALGGTPRTDDHIATWRLSPPALAPDSDCATALAILVASAALEGALKDTTTK